MRSLWVACFVATFMVVVGEVTSRVFTGYRSNACFLTSIFDVALVNDDLYPDLIGLQPVGPLGAIVSVAPGFCYGNGTDFNQVPYGNEGFDTAHILAVAPNGLSQAATYDFLLCTENPYSGGDSALRIAFNGSATDVHIFPATDDNGITTCPSDARIMDVNGDGFSDIVYMFDSTQTDFVTHLRWKENLDNSGHNWTTHEVAVLYSAQFELFDVNRDGKLDVITANQSLEDTLSQNVSFIWLPHTGINFSAVAETIQIQPFSCLGCYYIPMHIDGDNILDMLVIRESPETGFPPKVVSGLAVSYKGITTAPWFSLIDAVNYEFLLPIYSHAVQQWHAADINGDGFDDLVHPLMTVWAVNDQNNGFVFMGLQPEAVPFCEARPSGEFVGVGDFNRDGATDVVYVCPSSQGRHGLNLNILFNAGTVCPLGSYAEGSINDFLEDPVDEITAGNSASTYRTALETNCPPCIGTNVSFVSNAMQCTQCPAGQTRLTASSCIDCPVGSYSIHGGLCTPCLNGSYSVAPASTSCSPCSDCGVGASFVLASDLTTAGFNRFNQAPSDPSDAVYVDTIQALLGWLLLGAVLFIVIVGVVVFTIVVCQCSGGPCWNRLTNIDLIFKDSHRVAIVPGPLLRRRTHFGALMTIIIVIVLIFVTAALSLRYSRDNTLELDSQLPASTLDAVPAPAVSINVTYVGFAGDCEAMICNATVTPASTTDKVALSGAACAWSNRELRACSLTAVCVNCDLPTTDDFAYVGSVSTANYQFQVTGIFAYCRSILYNVSLLTTNHTVANSVAGVVPAPINRLFASEAAVFTISSHYEEFVDLEGITDHQYFLAAPRIKPTPVVLETVYEDINNPSNGIKVAMTIRREAFYVRHILAAKQSFLSFIASLFGAFSGILVLGKLILAACEEMAALIDRARGKQPYDPNQRRPSGAETMNAAYSSSTAKGEAEMHQIK